MEYSVGQSRRPKSRGDGTQDENDLVDRILNVVIREKARVAPLEEKIRETRLDRIWNVVIREKVGVAPLEENMRKTRLKWFGHVKMRSVNAPVRRCEVINLMPGRRGRERLKINWNEVIRGDLKLRGLLKREIRGDLRLRL